MKREGLEWLADNPLYTKRFAFYVGRRCRESTVRAIAEELHLDWETVKELDKQYMREQLRRAGCPAPRVIGIDEIAVGRRHSYRIVVSDLERGRPIWFGGKDRSEASLDEFFAWLGPKKCRRDSPGRDGHVEGVPQVHPQGGPCPPGPDRLRQVPRHEPPRQGDGRGAAGGSTPASRGRIAGSSRGSEYNLLSREKNLTTKGKQALKLLFRANKRLHTAYLLKESFDQLWDYNRPGWARRFFDELERRLEVATAGAVPEVRPDGRGPLGWDRGLLP